MKLRKKDARIERKSHYKDGDYAKLADAIMDPPVKARAELAASAQWTEALKPSNDLDKSVRELPYLFYQVCDAYADAINDQRRSKDRLDEAYAAAEARVWSNQKEGERITVAKAKALADADHDVIKYTKRYRFATEAVNKLEALKLAYQQKASMLKAEVELVASQFIQRDHVKPKTRAFKFSETK